MFIKKNVLAIALVAGLGMAGAANAYTLTTNTDQTPEKVATASVINNTTVITMTEEVQFNVGELDLILGRTTGFNVRFELSNGARFATTPTPVAGDDLPAPPAATDRVQSAGSSFVVFAVTPPASSPTGIQPGELITLTGVQINNATYLQTNGNQITGTSRYIDPVGASEIGSANTILLQSGNPVSLSCDAEAGDVNTRIDVGQDETQGSKTYFSSTGEIGALDENTIDLGDIIVTKDPAFGSFEYVGTDSFTTVVNGNFAAFAVAGNALYLSNDECASAITATGPAINTANGTATFTYTATNAGFDADGGTLQLCGRVADGNETVIDASSVSVRTTFNRTGTPAVTGAACSLLPLQYNGSVVRVYAVNPAGNSTAQSFLRVINQSNTAGRVTIDGYDDAGVYHGPVSLNLGALQSVQVNSDDLENGNAAKGIVGSLGDGAGKWRLFVTGEFSGMVVQSLNRNATDGTVTNLTDADTRGEQVMNSIFEGANGPF